MSNFNQPPIVVPPYSPVPSPPPTPSLAMDYGSQLNQGQDLRDYIQILLKRKWLIIGSFLTIFLLAAVYTFTRTPIFRTNATLQITQDNPSQVTMDEKLAKFTDMDATEKFQQTQYKILQSRSLAQRIVRALNLVEHPDFKSLREGEPKKSLAEIEDAIVSQVAANLRVSPLKGTYLSEVSFESPNKTLTQQVVNAIADEYMYLSIERRNESFALVRKWLDYQLKEMAAKVQEAQKKLYKFGQKSDIYTMEEKDNVIVQKFVDLSSLLTKAQAEKMAREAQFQQIKDKGLNAPLIVNHPLVAQLRTTLVAQQAKVSAMKKVYRGGHPELQAEEANLAEMNSRLQTELQRLQESIKADYEAARRTEILLDESLTAQKGKMVKLQDNLSDFQILKRDALTNEQLYQALLSRVKEANIAGTMVPSNVAVIDSALLPLRPFKPKTTRDLALAAVLGLTCGVGLAFVLEYLDDSIKSIDDLERSCLLPSLGMVPLLGNNSRISLSRREQFGALRRYLPWLQRGGQSNGEGENPDLMVATRSKSPVSEAVHHIYSSLMLSTSGRPPCIIMITSPNPQEGKSMLVSNLAICCAINDRRVILLDCDLRKPRLAKIFQIDSSLGLSNYLAGSATLEEIIHPTAIPNLSIIPAGPHPPNPANLLNSEVFKELLTELRQQFHHIIIDTPPVLGFADARFISLQVDGILLVTKHQSTNKSAGRMASHLLSSAPVLGTVLNCVGFYGQHYGNYYYYQYQYKYYSKYEDKSA